MKLFFEIMCKFGFHIGKERLTVQMQAQREDGRTELIDVYYYVCPHCGDGDPFITGEW